MSIKHSVIAAAVTAVLVANPVGAGRGGGAPNGPAGGGQGVATQVYQAVTAEEEASLAFMREEEKLARDVYLNLYWQWQARLFQNISNAEQRHMDAVKSMLDKYGLADPADADNIGWFSNAGLQTMYDDLMELGAQSYLDALYVGALIEEVDIEDNQKALDATDNVDLQTLYAKLIRGSRNHLRAFVAEIERQGVVYEAQHLDQSVVDEIVDSPTERGGSANGNGSGGRRR